MLGFRVTGFEVHFESLKRSSQTLPTRFCFECLCRRAFMRIMQDSLSRGSVCALVVKISARYTPDPVSDCRCTPTTSHDRPDSLHL